nr:uncharacterized protein LOC119168558 [Rhipicephalus microplus]
MTASNSDAGSTHPSDHWCCVIGYSDNSDPNRSEYFLESSTKADMLRCQQQFGDQSSTSIVTILIAIIIVVGIAVVISFLVLGGDAVPDDLVCTLGAFAVINAMYPPDGLCDYLFYTHVIVFNKTELVGVEVNASWTLFKKEIAARSMTAGGVSFDFKYVTAQAFDDQAMKKHLDKLASANIKNYGILNMVTSVKTWDDSMNRARGTIAKLKEIQGDDSNRKIVIALGLFDYNEPNAWDKYRKGFRDAVENTMADTVIAISSMSMVESSDTCYAAPTSVLDSSRLQDPARTTAKSYPDLKTHAALVSANVMYNKNSTRLGLSFEMGALFYSLNETTDSLEKRAYHPCERFYLTGLDIVILFTLTSLSRLSFTLNYSQLRIALLSFPPTYYPSLLSSSSSLSFYTPLLVVSL